MPLPELVEVACLGGDLKDPFNLPKSGGVMPLFEISRLYLKALQ